LFHLVVPPPPPQFPWTEGSQPVGKDLGELLLNRTWRPQLAVTGVEGFPPLEMAGNVLRSFSTFMISLRLPPTANATDAAAKLKAILEQVDILSLALFSLGNNLFLFLFLFC